METIVDRAAYDRDDTGFWRRMPWVSGSLFGIMMVAASLWSGDSIITALISSGAAAVLFAVFFRLYMRRSVAGFQSKIYNADPQLVPALPAGEELSFRYRLPCGLVIDQRRVASGVLYLGPKGFLFQATAKGPFREMAPLTIPRTTDLRIELSPLPMSGLVKLINPKTLQTLVVHQAEAHYRFSIPDPPSTFARIESCLAAMQPHEHGTPHVGSATGSGNTR